MGVDILSLTLFRLNLSVAFTKSFGHKSRANIHLNNIFEVVRQVSQIYFFKKYVFRKRTEIFM